MGHNVSQGFFAQHQLESLNMNNDLIQELKDMASDHTELELRSLLGSFLFVGDDVFKKMKVLSGGEKSRVALAKTLIDDSNFLMLDEPTNHLDFTSTEMLIQALQQYEGTFIAVSHNRHFIREVANKIWFIENYELKEFPGTMTEYNYWMSNRDLTEEQVTKKTKQKKENTKPKSNADENKIRKLKKEVETIENEIEKGEEKKAEIEDEMSKPNVYNNADEMAKCVGLAEANENELKEKNEFWESLLLELEEMES
jgi:ATP-binding cassette subfamily F protein 3